MSRKEEFLAKFQSRCGNQKIDDTGRVERSHFVENQSCLDGPVHMEMAVGITCGQGLIFRQAVDQYHHWLAIHTAEYGGGVATESAWVRQPKHPTAWWQ